MKNFKIPTDAEFKDMNKDEQAEVLEAMKKVSDAGAAMDAEAAGMPQMNMKDFGEMLEGVFVKALKPLTEVDRKHFALPGTGDPNGGGDPSPEYKFSKTIQFIKAMSSGEVNVVRDISKEVALKANLNESTATEGGFLVPEEFAAEILRLAPIYGVVRQNCRIMPMARDVMNIPAAGATNLDAQFINEGNQIKSTDPNFRQVQLVINKLAAIPKVTNEFLADANVPVVSYLAELIAESFAKKEDDQGSNGTGSPFTGVLQATGVPTSPNASGTGFICLSYADLVNAEGNVYSNVLGNAKWYFHRNMIAHIKGRITTTGAPIMPGASKEVLGYPVIGTEVLPNKSSSTAVTDGTPFALFGDLRKALIMGERGVISMKLSDQATVGNDNIFEKDMSALRVIERIAQSVALPSAVTRLIS